MFFLTTSVHAQMEADRKLNKDVTKILSSGFDLSALKDSIAMYSSAIRIDVKMVKGKCIVQQLSANDSLIYKMFKGLDKLKIIDYSSIIGHRKTARIIIPIVILIARYNNSSPDSKIILYDMPEKIMKMFDSIGHDKLAFPVSKNIYLEPYYALTDKSIYD